MNYEDYIELGKLTEEQEELLREVMSEDFRSESHLLEWGVTWRILRLQKSDVGIARSTGTKKGIMTAVPWCRDVMQSSAFICHLLRLRKESTL